MTFTDEIYYEEHRRLASAYCRDLHLRMEGLRRQLKNLERAFVVAATIKRKCEEEIIPIKVIPTGVGKKELQKQTDAIIKGIMANDALKKTLRKLLEKEGHIV